MKSSSDHRDPVELLADEFMERQRRGERPTIEEFCGRHPELADEIREVFPALAVMERVAPASRDLERLSGEDSTVDQRRIEQIGDYRILCEIGRGGMGVVYEAEQQSLGRRVALKILRRSGNSDGNALSRFQREARAAARMHHTNIVPVFEVGQDDEFVFYAMQLIQGQSLDLVIEDLRRLRSEHLQAKNHHAPDKAAAIRQGHSLANSLVHGHFEPQNLLDDGTDGANEQSGSLPNQDSAARRSREGELADTIALRTGSTASATLPGQSDISTADRNRRAYFRSVAEIGLQTSRALAYAHARGIVHRDIKPSNLLLDTAGVVWITDFGLAKTDDVAMTHTGDVLGTIRYMSPERFRGQCDVRADVYSLGLTLYELLTMRPAFESPDRLKLIEMVSRAEPTTPRSIDSRIPRDLETIVLKSIDKDPRRRYQSADDLLDDLQRFLDDQPIQARRVSSVERFVRWSRRNPLLSTAGAVATMALIAVALVSTLFARHQLRAAADQASLNSELKDSNAALQKSNEKSVDLVKQLQLQADSLRASQARLAFRQGEYEIERGGVSNGLLWINRALQLVNSENRFLRGRIIERLTDAAEDLPPLKSVWKVPENGEPIFGIARGYDYSRDITNSMHLSLKLRLAPSAFSADGELFCAVTPAVPDHEAWEPEDVTTELSFWDVETGRKVFTPLRFEHGIVEEFALSPDNRRIAALVLGDWSERDAAIRLIVSDLRSGDVCLEPILLQPREHLNAGHFEMSLFFNEAGTEITVAKGCQGGHDKRALVRSWSSLTGELVQERALSGSPGQPIFVTKPTGARIGFTESYSDDWRTRAGAGVIHYDKMTRERLETHLRVSVFESRNRKPLIAALGDDDKRVAVVTDAPGGQGHQIEIWDLLEAKRVGPVIANDGFNITAIAVNKSVTQLLVGGHARSKSETGKDDVFSSSPPASGAQSERREQSLAAGQVRIWDIGSGQPVTLPVPTEGPPSDVAFGADGETFHAFDQRSVRTWDVPKSGLQRVVIPNVIRPMSSARVSSSGLSVPPYTGVMAYSDARELLIARNEGFGIRLLRWDSLDGKPLSTHLIADTKNTNVISIADDARVVATVTCMDGADGALIRCYSTQNCKQIGTDIQLDYFGLPVAVDAEQVAIVYRSDEALLLRGWDLQSGVPKEKEFKITEFKVPAPTRIPVDQHFQFTASSLLAVAYPDRVEILDLTQGKTWRKELSGSTVTGGSSTTGFVSSDGTLLADVRDPGALHVLNLDSGQRFGLPIKLPDQVTSVAFNSDNTSIAVAMQNGQMWQWSLSAPWADDAAAIEKRIQSLTGLALDEQDRLRFLDVRSAATADRTSLLARHFTIPEQAALLTASTKGDASGTSTLSKWIAQHPDDWLPHFLLARSLVEQGELEKASKEFKTTVKLVDRQLLVAWIMRDCFLTQNAIAALSMPHGPEMPLESEIRRERKKLRWYIERALELMTDSSGDSVQLAAALAQVIESAPGVYEGPKWARQVFFKPLLEVLDEKTSAGFGSGTPNQLRSELVDRLPQELRSQWSQYLGIRERDTSDWHVGFEQDFQSQPALQPWVTKSGSWTTQGDAWMGTLVGTNDSVTGEARIELTSLWMPTPVEIEFETWGSGRCCSQVELVSSDGSRGYIAGFGRFQDGALADNGNAPIVPVLEIKGWQGTAPGSTVSRVAQAPQHLFETTQKHRVRFLREAERLTLFINDQEVLSRAVDYLESSTLALSAIGPIGSTVFFDHLRVRVPAHFDDDSLRAGQGRLEYSASKSRQIEGQVTSVVVSDDGRFVYTAAYYGPDEIQVFSRNVETGELTSIQRVADNEDLFSVISLQLSPDGRNAVATALRSGSVVLFRRNENGTLTKLDVAKQGIGGVDSLDFAMDAAFSPDSRFVYIGAATSAAITTFEITRDEKLRLVGVSSSQDGCFANLRGLAVTPNGESIVATSTGRPSIDGNGTLVVLRRDPETGETSIRQILSDNQDGVQALGGAMAVAVSADSKFVYASSGRFGGDDAVSVYRFNESGELSLVQELVNDRSGSALSRFEGGNQITVSPDGRNVYAVASASCSLACFLRDPETGRLTFIETIGSENGSLGVRGAGAAGIAVSPDGRFVLVAAEDSERLSVYHRKTSDTSSLSD